MYILNECGLAIVNVSTVDTICIQYPMSGADNYRIGAFHGKAFTVIAVYESLEEARTALERIFTELKYNTETLDLTR